MPSTAWHEWDTTRTAELDEIEAAHAAVGGTGRGRRCATEQINHAYAVLLTAQFQGFCRDPHSECVEHFVHATTSPGVRDALLTLFLLNRGLDRGNASAGILGGDFGRLGIEFWARVYDEDPRNRPRREALEQLNAWRNAIAHQDFDPAVLGGTAALHLTQVRAWRRACDHLAQSFDRTMRAYFLAAIGIAVWEEG
jgi:hypothetical protein